MSSTYAMNTEYTRAFGDPSEGLDRTVRLQAVPSDDVAAKEKLEPPDLRKIDTQGSELDILRGSRTCYEKPH